MTIKKYLLLLLTIGLLASCDKGYDNRKLEALQAELASAKSDLDQMRTDFDFIKSARKKAGLSGLVHQVFFKLKPGISAEDKAAFIAELKGLSAIELAHNLTVGEFEDLKDPRALAGHGVSLLMSFDSQADYEAYQSHEIHLKSKENTAKYLGGPPTSYDFMAK